VRRETAGGAAGPARRWVLRRTVVGVCVQTYTSHGAQDRRRRVRPDLHVARGGGPSSACASRPTRRAGGLSSACASRPTRRAGGLSFRPWPVASVHPAHVAEPREAVRRHSRLRQGQLGRASGGPASPKARRGYRAATTCICPCTSGRSGGSEQALGCRRVSVDAHDPKDEAIPTYAYLKPGRGFAGAGMARAIRG
jgi:hypothetical protein